jgi:hypothetical protein
MPATIARFGSPWFNVRETMLAPLSPGDSTMTVFRLTLLVCAGLTSLPVFAADAAQDSDRSYHDAAISAARVKLVTAATAARSGGNAKAMGSYTGSGSPFANEYRAYPPSCAAWPLPDASSGSPVSKRMALYSRDAGGNAVTPETVTVTIWRVPCSSSGSNDNPPGPPYNTDGLGNAMTFMRIDRDAANEGRTDKFPTFPLLNIKQGNITIDKDASAVRAAAEPNTFVTDGPYDSPILVSTTYALENYNFGADYNHHYSYAFDLVVNPFIANQAATTFSLGDYTGSGLAAMPLDGYVAAQYYNSARNEGLLIQMGEGYDPANPYRRQVIFDLLTEDLNGAPFWLVGSAAFDNTFPTSLSVPITYLVNGNTTQPWGSATVVLRNCNQLDVTFAPKSGLAAPVPSFSGKVTYSRIFAANGLMCE